MSDTPDVSQVISLLMQNPAIIENISSLLANKTEPTQVEQEKSEEVTTSLPPRGDGVKSHSNRSALLGVIKPYLRSSRATAIDSMIGILDVLDKMRGK